VSSLLDKLLFFKKPIDTFADGHGALVEEDRSWEDSYRQRWQYDKIVRSTHGVNCTGSCSWNVYVKGGLVTWETQALDYPRTRADLPNHEPRGCARGASASWYLYSAQRIKHPLIRRRLLELWREARLTLDPVEAWKSIVEDPDKTAQYKPYRGRGGFVRAEWDELNELIAASNVYTIGEYGPDRVAGFSPIPAMSMISYSAGARYVSLLGGTMLSFYDWYADLPPASPQTFGEQTDVPESADWYSAAFIMVMGSNVPQTRTPDAHFLTEVRYKGTKTVVVSPDYSEASKFADLWISPKQGTDTALNMAMGHVILKEFHLENETPYFADYCREYTDMPCLVRLDETDNGHVPGRFLRASDFDDSLGESNNPDWKTVAFDELTGQVVVPKGSIGFRWGEDGRWNLENREATQDREVRLRLSLDSKEREIATVALPYFGGEEREFFDHAEGESIQLRNVPVKRLKLGGEDVLCVTVYDLMMAHYGLERGFGGNSVAQSYDDMAPYTPAWAEKITGVSRDKIIAIAREFADTAAKTEGRSMVIIGAGVNHWYHNDMTYRSVINMLMMCGCIGKSGGGWAHYVGQEKLRPQAGWTPLAFGLDWARPPRQMNATSYWYAHTDQWRYERHTAKEMISPTAPEGEWDQSLIDYNTKAVRMGWLPSSPQLESNPLGIAKAAKQAGKEVSDYVAQSLQDGNLNLAVDDPDNPRNFPRNLFVWRSNLLGSSAKGHEYFLKHLLGAKHGVMNEDLGHGGGELPKEVKWRDEAPEGKLDLLVTIDFRMSSTCMYSDIVLPTATWYEKNDLSTTDMHPYIHPLTGAVDPIWGCRSDWEIFKGFAEAFSAQAEGKLGVEEDVVLTPLLHDSPGELGQPLDVKDWKKGECDAIPGVTMPSIEVVSRDYPNTYKRFTSLGPLMESQGNSVKGIAWDAASEVQTLKSRNGSVTEPGPSMGLAKIETDLHACETILALAPETNGKVAVRSWEVLSKKTGLPHAHLAKGREADTITFDDIVAQPRKVITAPTWSGVESDEVTYTGSYLNVHERIPWRTLSGRQHIYQDHSWMRAFGESLAIYRPPLDTRSLAAVAGVEANGNPELALNFLTPHQKWGIHSSYSESLPMLTLSRGGPCIWVSEDDARKLGISDNDWIEAFNANGALSARAIVSQRVKPGSAMMYHSQDKIVNAPGTETTGTRGIHNSVSKITMKPTHMIGGYAHLSYGFNYYGTVGANRDEFVIIRKISKLDWLDGHEPRILEPASANDSVENTSSATTKG
jgi:nitrate reductase alpha subunit